MNIAIAVVQGVAIIVLPLLLMKLRNTKLVKTFGTVGMAYFVGIVIALIVFGLNKLGINFKLNSDVGEIGSHVAIGIAIPLLLFGTNFTALKRLSKRTFASFGLLTVSVLIVSVALSFVFGSVLTDSGKLAGMAIGLYTGGTPNLNAIGSILGVPQNIVAVSNLSDMLIGGVFYIFLLTLCKPLLKKILKAPKPAIYMEGEEEVANVDDFSQKSNVKNLVVVIGIAVLIALLGAGIGVLVWYLTGAVKGRITDYLVPAILITGTILGLAGSFNKKLRMVQGTGKVGHFLILVFSLALAMSIDFTQINMSYLYIFLMFSSITICTFIVHVILCKIFKIDVDCCMVTLTAGVYGPAFIPAITKQIGDDKLTPVGLVCGSLGYAIGTFLGVGGGYLLALVS